MADPRNRHDSQKNNPKPNYPFIPTCLLAGRHSHPAPWHISNTLSVSGPRLPAAGRTRYLALRVQ